MRRWPASWADRPEARAAAVLWSVGSSSGWRRSDRVRLGRLHALDPRSRRRARVLRAAARMRSAGIGARRCCWRRLASAGSPPIMARRVVVHRGVLVHLLVAYPGWRPRSRRDAVAVSLSATSPRWCCRCGRARRRRSCSRWLWWRSLPEADRVSGTAAPGAADGVVATVMFAVRAARGHADPADRRRRAVTSARLVYELGVVCGRVVAHRRAPLAREPSTVVDLVVELTAAPSGTLVTRWRRRWGSVAGGRLLGRPGELPSTPRAAVEVPPAPERSVGDVRGTGVRAFRRAVHDVTDPPRAGDGRVGGGGDEADDGQRRAASGGARTARGVVGVASRGCVGGR